MINKLYTYIITDDNGLSPCYDHNTFTLACCKPQIRRMIYSRYRDDIKSGDANIWIAGIKRDKVTGEPFIVYIAKISDVIKLEEYYRDGSDYAARSDCKYRNVKTVEELPVSFKKKDRLFERYFPDIYAKENNEHGKFKDLNELNKWPDAKYNSICKDICGRCVLISDMFAHCSWENDKYALTQKLMPCMESVLDGYRDKNMRHFHSFSDWTEFENCIKKIDFNSGLTVTPLDKWNGCKKHCGCC